MMVYATTKKWLHLLFFILLVPGLNIKAQDFDVDASQLFHNLEIIKQLDAEYKDEFPCYYNHHITAGYFVMPSARMPDSGTVAIGGSYVTPYCNYGLSLQMFDILELSGDYRICRGMLDTMMQSRGFGDYADRGANFKFGIPPRLSNYELPGIAFGVEDFMGSEKFRSEYVVLTKVFKKYNAEVSLGYGWDKYEGVFGGIMWLPFRQKKNFLIKDIALAGEYNAYNYSTDLYYKAHNKKSPINYGIKWHLFDCIDFSLSRFKGTETAVSVYGYYNLGTTKGIVAKNKDPKPYKAPIDVQPIGEYRPEQVMIQEMTYAFRSQSIKIMNSWITTEKDNTTTLYLTIINSRWRQEQTLRERVQDTLAALTPSNIDKVVVIVERNGLLCYQYTFLQKYLSEYRKQEINTYELAILSPVEECNFPPKDSRHILEQSRNWWNFDIEPKLRSHFGSAHGKYKYDFGILLGVSGMFENLLFYSASLRYTLMSSFSDVNTINTMVSSHFINVHTDIMRYRQQQSVTLNNAFLQRNWNMGKGFFSRLAAGYFESAYAGVGGEILYYPIEQDWAIGIEGAALRKRKYSGLGFQRWVSKPTSKSTFTYLKFKPWQGFINLYYYIPKVNMSFRLRAGQFLARDKGFRLTATRYFPSGLSVSAWFSYTNPKELVNSKRYADQGIGFSMPIDFLLPRTALTQISYGLSVWLRDSAYASSTGKNLYPTVFRSRYNYPMESF